MLLHEQELDSGSVSTGNSRIGYLPQEIILQDEDCTVLEYLQGGRPISRLEAELNQIINKILFINKATHKISVYDGNYDTYKEKYAQEQRLRERAVAQEEKESRELEDFVRRANQASRTFTIIYRSM